MQEQTTPSDTDISQQPPIEEPEVNFKNGEEITLVRVRFPGNSKSFPFLLGERKFQYGQKVLAMSDRGMDVGYINSFPYKVKFKKEMLPLRPISRNATQEDIEEQKSNVDTQKKAAARCKELAIELNLDMTVTHVELIQFGKKMVFYFNSPGRVDFRELVKKLVAELKMRIELRQIGVRDRVAALGSIGACGLSTCCSTFLKNYGNVSLKLAKNQNLALIPSKINGVCGQVKCCVKYEDDVYTQKRRILPKEGSFIQTKNGDIGKVTKLHLLKEQFDMITDQGMIRRYTKGQYEKSENLPKGWKFPKSFEYVKNETSKVIGIEELSSAQTHSDFLQAAKDKADSISGSNPEVKADKKSNTQEKPVESESSSSSSQDRKKRNRPRKRRNYKKKS